MQCSLSYSFLLTLNTKCHFHYKLQPPRLCLTPSPELAQGKMSIDWNGDLFTACYKRRPGFLELYKFSFGESCPEVNSSELVHVETMTDKKKRVHPWLWCLLNQLYCSSYIWRSQIHTEKCKSLIYCINILGYTSIAVSDMLI